MLSTILRPCLIWLYHYLSILLFLFLETKLLWTFFTRSVKDRLLFKWLYQFMLPPAVKKRFYLSQKIRQTSKIYWASTVNKVPVPGIDNRFEEIYGSPHHLNWIIEYMCTMGFLMGKYNNWATTICSVLCQAVRIPKWLRRRDWARKMRTEVGDDWKTSQEETLCVTWIVPLLFLLSLLYNGENVPYWWILSSLRTTHK